MIGQEYDDGGGGGGGKEFISDPANWVEPIIEITKILIPTIVTRCREEEVVARAKYIWNKQQSNPPSLFINWRLEIRTSLGFLRLKNIEKKSLKHDTQMYCINFTGSNLRTEVAMDPWQHN